jgi:hypothetical protein
LLEEGQLKRGKVMQDIAIDDDSFAIGEYATAKYLSDLKEG